ncbi:MAG TPA: murein biosynthesis integral membrane protein MurJ, partial [Erysipelothrix sp.]|nr:murein biosynthesis integral membrane protein MurJ [Erysipelothrix sp.]
MSSSTKNVAKSAAIIVILGLLAKPLGFLREMLMGSKFGSSMETDTYILALSAIALFSGLLSKTINTTLIPILSEVEEKEGKEGKILHTNNFLNLIILASFILMLAGMIFTPLIVKLIAPGFDSTKQFNLAILLIRIGIPALIFDSTKGVLIGFLQTEGRFKEGAAVGIPLNLTFIIYLAFLSERFGIIGLMFTATLASIVQLVYVMYGLKDTPYKHSLHVDIHDEYIKKILVLIPPILISVGISDFNSIIDKSIGSTLVEGSISALNYAEKLGQVVRMIFVTAITTVMYPEFAKAANKGDHDELKESIITAINLTLLITVPATVGMILLSTPIVKLAFERNKFDAVATAMTSSALIFTALRMASSSIRILLHNVFYSLQDTKVPLYVGGFAVGVN